jgi:hypothetical protein
MLATSPAGGYGPLTVEPSPGQGGWYGCGGGQLGGAQYGGGGGYGGASLAS